jgi:uncharacterized membrane protein YkoI
MNLIFVISKKFLTTACIGLMLMSTSIHALAASQLSREQVTHLKHEWYAARGNISKAEAIQIVKNSVGGRVLSAKRAGKHYRVKVVTRGVVRVYYVDAVTGEISR